MKKYNKTIAITGGHLAPAVAVIEEIREQKKPWNMYFIGRANTVHDASVSEEKRSIEKLHIPFFSIHAGRITRYISVASFVEILRIPVGFIEACWFCIRHHPDAILSFGGYIGLPVVIAGWLFGVKTIIHEQTHDMGLSNRIAAQIADRILITFKDTKHSTNNKNVSVIGLPLRKSFFHPPKKPSFAVPNKKPIIYVTGGTTGAVSLNELLFPSIEKIVSTHVVIHQTGPLSIEKALAIKKELPESVRENYIPFSYIESNDVSWIMHQMTLLVGRSGANTTVETAVVKKPAVFVPLPWAGSNEQKHNALWYQKIANVIIIDQQHSTPSTLLAAIIEIVHVKSQNHTNVSGFVSNAAFSVVETVSSALETS